MRPSAAPALGWREELGTLIRFGGPIVLAQFGFLFFSLVDIFMVGHLGSGAVGGVGACNSIYWFMALTGSGVLFSLDPMISQARGRGDLAHQVQVLFQALWVAGGLSVLFLALLIPLSRNFGWLGLAPGLHSFAEPYFRWVFWSGPLFFFFVVFQRFAQAQGWTREILAVVVVANGINVATNWTLIFGHLGFAPLGIQGAAAATLLSRLALVFGSAGVCLVRLRPKLEPGWLSKLGPAPEILKPFLAMGIPAAGMLAFETGTFSIATQMAARLDPASADAHQIGVVLVSALYMLPTGLASTAAFRVGFLLGSKAYQDARRVGTFYILSAASSMAVLGIAFAGYRTRVFQIFGSDPAVLAQGAKIAPWIAALLVFDATQVTTAGALRGYGSTRAAAWANFIGYYLVGLPLAVTLCFGQGWGVQGIWIGLFAGITTVSLCIFTAWIRTKHLEPPEES